MATLIYKCPNCGNVLEYDAEKSVLTCDHCNSSFTPAQVEAAASQTTAQEFNGPTHQTASDQQFEQSVATYQCPSCGAEIISDPNAVATFCTFCGSPTIIESKLEGVFRPAQLIPFTISKQEAQASFKKWCKNGRFTPADFASPQELEKITGMYVPFWLFDCRVDGGMTARGTKVRTWPMGDYLYTNTKTYSIRRRAIMNYTKVPADGSKNMDDATMDKLEPYDYSALQPFQMPYLSGFQAEKYDQSAKEVFPRIQSRLDEFTEGKMASSISGFNTVTDRIFANQYRGTDAVYTLLPVWIHRYVFKGQTYQFMMNGQTGKVIGIPPVDKGRVALRAVLTGLAISAALFAGGLLLL